MQSAPIVAIAVSYTHLDVYKRQSLLFVGPTGVGKTEVARQLAKELGIELVRFDMSAVSYTHLMSDWASRMKQSISRVDFSLR